ncbi:MAG: biotin/lipoyl-binding protein, partial [Verrucomicrobiota bacterium]
MGVHSNQAPLVKHMPLPDKERQDYAVREIEASHPKLRGDLTFTVQEFRGERCCVVEDPTSGKFYRIGLREYYFIRQLDGKKTVGKALADMAGDAHQEALTEGEATSILRWLLETGLAATGESARADLMFSKVQQKRDVKIKTFTNILFFKHSLGNPDRLIDRLTRLFGFWVGWPGWALGGILFMIGLSLVIWNWDTFLASSEGVLAADNWLWLAVAWVLLKIVHESWHGIVCKYYGGKVPDAGVLFVLFTPMGYVDATSSWRFSNKWKRIHVSAAGMFIEAVIAAIAVMVWAQNEPSPIQTIAYNVVIMATVVTIVFNANPLLKFDGYYILADLLEIPNLYQRGQTALKNASRKFLIGIPNVEVIDWNKREEVFIFIYGVAAFIWRILILVTILTAASFLFGGGGKILALLAGLGLVIPATKKLFTYLKEGKPGERPNPKIYGLRIGGLIAALLLLAFFPFRPTLTAPGITDFGDASIVRVECPGFVEKVHVTNGSRVRKGDVLVTLRNDDAKAELRRIRMELKQAQIKSRNYQTEGNVTASQIEAQKLEGLQKQYREQQAFVRSLELRALEAGRVVARSLENLRGTYLRTGREVATVEQRRVREVTIAIPQPDIDLYRLHQDHPVWVKIRGRNGKFYGLMQSPDPQASKNLPHMALSGLVGGPLPVRPRKDIESPESDEDHYELINPHFSAKIEIKERLEEDLKSGESVIAKFTSRQSNPLWKWAYKKIGGLMQTLTQQAE